MFSDYNTEEQDTCNIEQNLKQKWLPLYQKDTQLAMKILIALKSDIQKQMSSFIQSSIDYMKSLDDQVQELQLKSNQIGSLLYQLPSQVYNNPNQLNLLISESLVDGERIKEFLKIKLRNFVDSDNLINFIQKIQQIKFDDSIRIFNRIFQPQQNQKDGNWTCNQHNERIRYVQLNEEVSNKIACEYCRQDNKYGQYITLQSLKNRWNEYILETAKSFNLVQNKLVSKSNIISQTISSLQLHFQKLIDQINQQLNNQSTIELNKLLNIKNKNNILYQFSNTLENDQFHQQFQLMQYDWSEFSTGQLGDVAYICRQKNQIEQIEQESIYKDIQITNMLNQSKCFTNMMIIQFESFLKYWNKPQINYNQNSEIVESGNQAVPLNYQLLEQYNVKEENVYHLLSIVTPVFWLLDAIVLLRYLNLNKANQHQDKYQTTIKIMTNQFISGCNDCKIMIWSCDSNNLWYCSQVLEGHTDYVRAGVIMNNREDLIISGCDDRSIRFWSKKDSQWHCKQILNGHSAEVRSLSLNPSSTQLISCSTGTEIFLTQYHQNRKQWCIIQIIPTNKCGYSLKFIKDDLFTFQPFDQEILQIYKREQEQQNFQIIQELKVNSKDNRLDFFSQQLIEEKSILLHKNGNTINIIQINQKIMNFLLCNQFKVQMSIYMVL